MIKTNLLRLVHYVCHILNKTLPSKFSFANLHPTLQNVHHEETTKRLIKIPVFSHVGCVTKFTMFLFKMKSEKIGLVRPDDNALGAFPWI